MRKVRNSLVSILAISVLASVGCAEKAQEIIPAQDQAAPEPTPSPEPQEEAVAEMTKEEFEAHVLAQTTQIENKKARLASLKKSLRNAKLKKGFWRITEGAGPALILGGPALGAIALLEHSKTRDTHIPRASERLEKVKKLLERARGAQADEFLARVRSALGPTIPIHQAMDLDDPRVVRAAIAESSTATKVQKAIVTQRIEAIRAIDIVLRSASTPKLRGFAHGITTKLGLGDEFAALVNETGKLMEKHAKATKDLAKLYGKKARWKKAGFAGIALFGVGIIATVSFNKWGELIVEVAEEDMERLKSEIPVAEAELAEAEAAHHEFIGDSVESGELPEVATPVEELVGLQQSHGLEWRYEEENSEPEPQFPL